jgi:hypothetical protein
VCCLAVLGVREGIRQAEKRTVQLPDEQMNDPEVPRQLEEEKQKL